MVANAVYLSSIKHSQPSIFEIWAEESLMATLQPAYQLLCDFISSNWPQRKPGPLKLILEWPNESFLVLNLIVQSTYLEWFSASFSESFYGLKRVNVISPTERLTTRAKILSLVGLVGAPYAMRKCKTIVDDYVFKRSTSGNVKGKELKLLQTFRMLNSIVRFIKISHYIIYLSGFGSRHSIFHMLAGVKLVHQNEHILSWANIFTLMKLEPRRANLFALLAFKTISQLMEFGAFYMQCINWWNTMDLNAKFHQKSIPKPIKSVYTEHCPTCKKRAHSFVVVSSSGFVYCDDCIKSMGGRCTISGLPFSQGDLIYCDTADL